MKRYKELSSTQKKSAIDFMFKRLTAQEIYRVPNSNVPSNIQKRLKEIREEIKFCGCLDCFNKYADKANKDYQVKEWILSKAMDAAEQAYYPEGSDNIIKVS